MSLAEKLPTIIPLKAKNIFITILLLAVALLFTFSPLNPQAIRSDVTELQAESRTVAGKIDAISRYLCVVDFPNAQLSGINCRDLIK